MIPTKNITKSNFYIRHNSSESFDANFDQVDKSCNKLCENTSHLSEKAADYLGNSMQSNDDDNVHELNENSCEFQDVIEGNDYSDGELVCNATELRDVEVQSRDDAADRDNDHFKYISGNTRNKYAGHLEHSDCQINGTYDRFDGNISNTNDVFGNINVTANQIRNVGDATRLDDNIKSCSLFSSLEFQHEHLLNKTLKQELPTEENLNPYSVKEEDCEISLSDKAKEADANLEEYFYKTVVDSEDCNDRSVSEETITEVSSLFSESERSPDCICKCHCRRSFLQNGKSKSRRITGQKRNDNLQYNSELSSSRGVIKPNESNLTKSVFRTRLKSFNLSETSAVSHTKGLRLWCNNVLSVQLKAKMAKIIFYCVILFLLCLCGGVLMMHKSSEESEVDNSDTVEVTVPLKHFKPQDKYTDKPVTETDSSLILDLPFRAVPKDEFENHLSRSKNAAEMLKIFFSDQNLTEEQVNSIMFMKSHETVYASNDIKANPMLNDEEDERSYRELAYQQYVEFQKSPLADCSEPRPEIETIVDTYSDSIRQYLPACTIVHRCRNTTACCPRGFVCAPKRVGGIELFERFFMVLEAVPGENSLRPHKDFIAAKTFINHTACECQRVEVDTNCHKDCPAQFSKHRPGVDCECVCKEGQRKCHRIHKGLLPLDEKDLECIKEERCIIPTCHEGEFNIFTGFCPHFRRSRRDKGKK